jgi:hypothetical protein
VFKRLDVAPDGAGSIFWEVGFYKYAAPTALRGGGKDFECLVLIGGNRRRARPPPLGAMASQGATRPTLDAEKGVVGVITKKVFLEEGEMVIFEKSGKAHEQELKWDLWDGNGTNEKIVSSVP